MQRGSLSGRTIDWLQFGIIVLVFVFHLPFVFAGRHEVMEWFRTDDAFYYFKTAQNITEGLGITFDGITPTNGFQPLWMAVIVPIFTLARVDLFLPLRVVILLQTVIASFTGVILYRMMSRSLLPVVSFAAALSVVFLIPLHRVTMIGGTEAGINALMISLLLYVGGLESQRPKPRMLRFGLIGALAFFARLDNLFLVGLVGPWALASWQLISGRSEGFDRSEFLRELAKYALPLAVFGGAYVLFNLVEFGHPTPISGQIKHWWGTLDLTVYGFPIHRPIDFLGQFMTDDRSLGPWSLITAPLYDLAEALMGVLNVPFSVQARRKFLFGEVMLLAAAVWGVLRWRSSRRVLGRIPLLPLFLACLMQISYYKISGHLAQKPWYWVGEGVLIVLAAAIVADTLARQMSAFPWGAVISNAVVATLLLALLAPHFGDVLQLFGTSEPAQAHYYLQRADWLREHTEPGAKIGMTGSGSTGYFTRGRTIVNLDGLISGHEYFEALRAGAAPAYLSRIGLDYVFGNDYILLETQPYSDIFPGNVVPLFEWPDPGRSLKLWRYHP